MEGLGCEGGQWKGREVNGWDERCMEGMGGLWKGWEMN